MGGILCLVGSGGDWCMADGVCGWGRTSRKGCVYSSRGRCCYLEDVCEWVQRLLLLLLHAVWIAYAAVCWVLFKRLLRGSHTQGGGAEKC